MRKLFHSFSSFNHIFEIHLVFLPLLVAHLLMHGQIKLFTVIIIIATKDEYLPIELIAFHNTPFVIHFWITTKSQIF